MIYVDFIIFVISLFLLLKGSDYLVESAAKLAKRFNLSEFVIGLSLVAIGTSIPELATAVAAIVAKDPDLIIGNVIGSNIANIGLILGVAAIFATLTIDKKIFYREGIFLLVMSVLILLFSLDRKFGLMEGIILLFFFSIFIVNLFKESEEEKAGYEKYLGYFYSIKKLFILETYLTLVRKPKNYIDHKLNHNNFKRAVNKGIKAEKKITNKRLLFYMLISIFSIVIISLGAHYLVKSAINIASFFNISSTFIGLTMIAIGTSLPELTVTITSIKKNYGNILIGNLMGSNIANLLLILGISSIFIPISISGLELVYTIPFMILLTAFLLRFIRSEAFLKRLEGITLLLLYLFFIFSLVFFL